MPPDEMPPEVEILTRIAEAPGQGGKKRTRWSIIMESCEKKCRQLRETGKKTGEIVEGSRTHMKELLDAFKKLLQDPAKIKLNEMSGEVELTDDGTRFLETLKQSPA